MEFKTIFAVLAGLGTTLTLACDKGGSGATEVPDSVEVPANSKAEDAGEHACGNHAEGACGGDTPADAAAVATTRSFEVAPGRFAEANFQMRKGASVTATFAEGSADIAWDVHSHDHSGGTKIHDKGAGGTGTVEFIAPEDGVFSILWKNGGATSTPLEVSISLGDGASIHSWMPAE